MFMKVYKTTYNLKNNQEAYLIKLDRFIYGHDYLCVDTNVKKGNEYKVGEVVDNIPSTELESSEYDIKNSPIYNTFLFQYFISKLSNRNVREILPHMIEVSNNSILTKELATELSKQLNLKTFRDFKLWLTIIKRVTIQSQRFFR